MSAKSTGILGAILLALVVLYGGVMGLLRQQIERYAIHEGEQQVRNLLLVHRAVHTYITEVQRPELYRLKEAGRLYPEYFAPEVMSFTFIARGIKDYLNAEREKAGLPPVYFKLASDNPRNPINQADDLEADLLRRMNAGELEEYHRLVEEGERSMLYVAVPINPSTPGCLRCHGDPEAAPAELVARYGDEAGFFEFDKHIRALISVRVPVDRQLAEARDLYQRVAASLGAGLAALFALTAYFVFRLDRKQAALEGLNRRLDRLSTTDYLTGALNRLGFSRALGRAVAGAERYGSPLAVVMGDIDHFKRVNDARGHAEGDRLLARFAELLQGRIRGADTLGRWGGEEFVVLVPEQDLEGARDTAEKLREAVAAGHLDPELPVTASFGVAAFAPGMSKDTLVDHADRALYAAKRNGRDRVEVYHP